MCRGQDQEADERHDHQASHAAQEGGGEYSSPQGKPSAQKPGKGGGQAGKQQADLKYGADWYTKTRELARPRTVRQELEYRRQADLEANNGRERKDLYTDNWDGSEYKGSPFNILTLLAALFVLVPAAGLLFAYTSYGTLWG